jgi:hypothetical protein
MEQSCIVRCDERTGHLDRYINGFLRFHRLALQTLAQRFAVDQITRDIVSRAIFADLVDCQDIWMIKRDDRARFLCKSLSGAPHRR